VLATACVGWTVFEVATGRVLATWVTDRECSSLSLAFSPDGTWLAVEENLDESACLSIFPSRGGDAIAQRRFDAPRIPAP
jgi:hypothetical protein